MPLIFSKSHLTCRSKRCCVEKRARLIPGAFVEVLLDASYVDFEVLFISIGSTNRRLVSPNRLFRRVRDRLSAARSPSRFLKRLRSERLGREALVTK